MLRSILRRPRLHQTFSGRQSYQKPTIWQTAVAKYHTSEVSKAALAQEELTSGNQENGLIFPPPSAKQFGQSQPQKWLATSSEALTAENITALFTNKISNIRIPNFLPAEDCSRLVNVINTHKIESYGADVYPPIGSVGITQFEHQRDKETYFTGVENAMSLQKRFMEEAKIDIVGLVRTALQKITGLPVRIAREDKREYFAGLLRLVNSSALIHADYGPYDGPSWEIGHISAQLSWNILLREIYGGECIVYNRPWRGSEDDCIFKQAAPSYGYMSSVVQGRESKLVRPKVGELTLFNSRNFHEVKAIEYPEEHPRYTLSSFIGLLPSGADGRGPEIILWS